MDYTNETYMFFAMSGLYFLSASFSLLFFNKHKISNLVTNIGCILGAILGIILSLSFILKNSNSLELFTFQFPVPYMRFIARLDGVSAFFILILSFLTLVVSIYSIDYISHYYGKKRVGFFNFFYAVFILSMALVFTAGNTILFFIVWELMSLVSYFLVAFEAEKKEARNASTLYIIMTHIGTAFLLLAFILMYVSTGSFDMHSLQNQLPYGLKNILFVLFLIGFGTKAGLVPMHVWLPLAHPAAPGNVSALMSGIMIKTAIYGLVRFLFDCLGIQSLWWGIVLLIVGMISILIGIAYAFIEKNIKKLLAYSSIENMGIILMGLGLAAIGAATNNSMLMSLALAAAILHTMNHAVFKGLLFLSAGSIDFAIGTKDMEGLGGLIKTMPYTGFFVLVGGLSISAIIPFNGFIGEWLTVQSFLLTVQPGQVLINIIVILGVATLAIAGAMAAGTFIKLIGIAFLGTARTEKAKKAVEVPKIMLLSKSILALICILTGIFPIAGISLVNGAFAKIMKTSVISNINGGVFVLWYPLKINRVGIMPVAVIAMGALCIVGFMILIKLFGGRSRERKYSTWDCGFVKLDRRMQYSATGFSKPIAMVLKHFYRHTRELQIVEGGSKYHPKSMHYMLSSEQLIEKYFYKALMKTVTRISRRVKFGFQTGSMHAYLIYIFVMVFVLLIYNKII